MTATQKKQRKMLSSFTILFLITVFVAVLSWIVPAGQYNLDGDNYIAGTYHVVDATRQGIWDVLTAPITGMIGNDATPGAIEVALFVMVVGGFLGVVTATGAIDAGIASRNWRCQNPLRPTASASSSSMAQPMSSWQRR